MANKTIAFIKSAISKNGGLEKYADQLLKKFQESGFSVLLLTAGEPRKFEYPVHFLCRKGPCSWGHLLHFDTMCRRYFATHHVDAIFGLDRNSCFQHFYRAGNGCHAAFLEHRRLYTSRFKQWYTYFNPLHRVILKMERETFEQCPCLFVNSQMVRNEIQQYYPQVDPNKICVIHNGVEWQQFEEDFQSSFRLKEPLCRTYGLDPAKFQFLFIGNDYRRKGLLLLFQACALLSEPFELSIVGYENNIEYFRDAAKKLGVSGKVHFFGSQVTPMPFLQIADACVIPSYYDPFANVTIEALAMGLFVISSSKNGGSEIITSPQQGIVFEDYTPASLAAALSQALHHPKQFPGALSIRNSVQHRDFSSSLQKYVSRVGFSQ